MIQPLKSWQARASLTIWCGSIVFLLVLPQITSGIDYATLLWMAAWQSGAAIALAFLVGSITAIGWRSIKAGVIVLVSLFYWTTVIGTIALALGCVLLLLPVNRSYSALDVHMPDLGYTLLAVVVWLIGQCVGVIVGAVNGFMAISRVSNKRP